MNTRTLGLLAATLITVPMIASAQDTTLDYQGYVMGGTSTTYIYPATVPPPGSYQLSQIESAPVSTIATIDATLTYSGSVAQNNLVIDSYAVNLTANNGQNFEIQNIGAGIDFQSAMNGTSSCLGAELHGCITLTTSGNAVTGATINLAYTPVQGPIFYLSIGPSGDAFSYAAAYVGEGGVNCNIDNANPGNYVGSFRATPCTLNVSNPTAGVWAQAPEIDPTSVASGLTLLLGGILVLGGRRTASLAT